MTFEVTLHLTKNLWLHNISIHIKIRYKKIPMYIEEKVDLKQKGGLK